LHLDQATNEMEKRLRSSWKIIILAAVPLLFGLAVLVRHDQYSSTSLVVYSIVLPLASIGTIAIGRWLGNETRATFANYALAVILALYTVEANLDIDWPSVGPALGFGDYRPLPHPVAMDGTPYDRRPRSEVVADLRQRFPGKQIVGQFNPEQIVDIGFPKGLKETNGDYILPLGGPSHSLVVTCNEMGYWGSFQSDRFGFNNPDKIWDSKPKIAIIGSSHTQGLCLRPGEGWVDRFRESYPDVANLGQSNSGPLYQFALIREYLFDVKPKDIIWVFCDCFDQRALEIELANATLSRYLNDPAFSQHLKVKQALIDSLEVPFIEKRNTRLFRLYQVARDGATLFMRSWPTLVEVRQNLKAMIGIKIEWKKASLPVDDGSDYSDYRNVMTAAKKYVGSWGGRIHVVYLPAVEYSAARTSSPYRRKIRTVAKDLGLTFTDLFESFDKLPEPAALHPFGTTGHLTPKGYRFMSDAIAADLGPNL
jgi:hypothetical protein